LPNNLQEWKKAPTFSYCDITENKHRLQPERLRAFSFSIGVGSNRESLAFGHARGWAFFIGPSPYALSLAAVFSVDLIGVALDVLYQKMMSIP